MLVDAQALNGDETKLDKLRALALRFVELLVYGTKVADRSEPDSDAPFAGWACDLLNLADLAGCKLLGTRLTDAIDVTVPGARSVRLEGHISRLPYRNFSSQERTVTGRVRAIVVGGRANRLLTNAHDVETHVRLRDKAIHFDESQRKAVAAAISTPGQKVTLTYVEETLDEGRAKPRVKRVLKSLVLEHSPQTLA